MTGRRLGHYEIVDEISRGGMGVVYRAVDLRLRRDVALKVLPDDLVHDAARRERLLEEARAASHLEHPNIAVIHDVDEADGVTFIAMELIRGEKLSDTLLRGPLPVKRALDLSVEMAEGLARAHEKAVVHRDIKPANVMVTEDGHVKLIDFGLAKLVERFGDDTATATVARPHTEPGVILGTASYMSPEQARGLRVDHRTDVFSLGVTLFEMVTGRPPFKGATSLDTMHAILTQPVPPLSTSAGVSSETTAQVQRIIEKCTAKDADDRYQGMKDLIVDLRGARRVVESPSTASVAIPPSRRSAAGVAGIAAAAAAVAAAAGLWWWNRNPPAAPVSGKPAVAVLYFENNTGDTSLDWMRTGLTDMVVTDLSQSTDFEVLGTDRLQQILQELKRGDDRAISADVVQEIARRAGVNTVLVGSYIKSGDTIRINARLQNPSTGKVVTSERVEGPGAASLFGLVDELTRRLKTSLTSISATPPALVKKPGAAAEETGLDRSLSELTTASVEAYQHYSEGLNLQYRGLAAQAIVAYERAVAIDPDFALALAKLAVVHNNLAHVDEREHYAKRAMALVNRLTPRERYYIEGYYYCLRPETVARGIEAYRQGLALHPEHLASRHNLALKYFQLERYQEAIEQNEELVRRGTAVSTTYGNLAGSYLAIGDPARGLSVAEAGVRRFPDVPIAYQLLGSSLVVNGRFADARAAYEKAIAMNPRTFQPRLGIASIGVFEGKWGEVETILQGFQKSADAFERFLGTVLIAELQMARGSAAAPAAMVKAAEMPEASALDRAGVPARAASLLMRLNRPADALALATRAAANGRGTEAEFETLEVLALAQAAAGRRADADKTLTELETRAAILPSPKEMRRAHFVRGEMARRRGDVPTAVDELTKAEALLPAHGPVLGPGTTHAEIWFSLAQALVAAGRDGDAIRPLERLQQGHERIFDLDACVRSFYVLAQIHERQGRQPQAREQYARFLEFRRDGQVDREWVATAAARVK
jgi:tetratricopeptide (TPR) repeat protein/TolB-like protein